MVYRKDIDGLRALAVLFVVAFHAFPLLLPNGFLGVDIFFVISGFLITSIILHNLDQNKFSFINFYIRRIKRIFPIAFLILVIISIIGALTLFDTEFKSLKTYIRSAAGFYINFQLLQDAGYFDLKSTYKPLLHYWSLAIEEQFYLVWPLLLFLKYKLVSFIFKKSKNRIFNSLIILNSLLLIAFYVYFLQQSSDQYFSSFVRAWELLIGCLASLVYSRINLSKLAQDKLNFWSPYLATLGLIFIAGSQSILNAQSSATLSVFGAAFYLLSKDKLTIKWFFKTKPMVFIGLISYSLYLWHWPFLSFYRIYKPNLSSLETAVLVLSAFIFSYITYRFIEAPLKNKNWDITTGVISFSTDRKIILKLAFCIIPAVFLFKYSPQFSKLSDKVVNRLDFVEDDALGLKPECLISKEQHKNLDLTWCYSDSKVKKYKGLIFGDSHSHALYKGFISNESDVAWQLIGKHSCPPFNVNNGNTGCRELAKQSLNTLKSEIDIQYVAFIMARRVFEENQKNLQESSFQQDIIQDLKDIQKSGKKIILVRPVPEIAENIYACTNQRFSFYKVFNTESACKINLNDWIEVSRAHNSFIDLIKSQMPDVLIADPLPQICDSQYCYATRDAQALYEDKDHLSYHGSQVVAKLIVESLVKTRAK